MSATTQEKILTQEEIKAAIWEVMKENPAEFTQFFLEKAAILMNIPTDIPKKTRKKKKLTLVEHLGEKEIIELDGGIKIIRSKNRVPYHEMPFWKANPDLKPLTPVESEAKPLSKDFFNALIDFAKDPELKLNDELLEDLD